MGGTRSRAIDGELCRQQQQRDHGGVALTVVGTPDVEVGDFVRWASVRDMPVVSVEEWGLEHVTSALITRLPHRTLLAPAQQRLAGLARRTAEELAAGLVARTPREREQWLLELGDGSAVSALAARIVAGGQTLPTPIGSHLASLAVLAEPFAVLVAPPRADRDTLAEAVAAAAVLAEHLRPHAVALAAPRIALDRLFTTATRTASLTLARQGLVIGAAPGADPDPPRGRSAPERELFAALEQDPRTRGRFTLSHRLPWLFHGQPAEVDLYASAVRFAVEIDGWHHFREPDGYRRDRAKDLALQRAGILVLRVLADDVQHRVDQLVDEIAGTLHHHAATTRRTQGET